MMAGSHVALGATAWFALAPQLGLAAMDPLSVGLAVGGALLPDIDHPKSWVGKRLRPVSSIIAAVFGHRGATHSLLAVAGCGWLLFHGGYPRTIVVPVLIGYLSHLLGDLLTARGLRLTWPFKGTWALPICRSGSPVEPLVVTALLVWAWCAAASPETRQAVITASRVCDLAGPDLPTSLCPPPTPPLRPRSQPHKRLSAAAASRAGPPG